MLARRMQHETHKYPGPTAQHSTAQQSRAQPGHTGCGHPTAGGRRGRGRDLRTRTRDWRERARGLMGLDAQVGRRGPALAQSQMVGARDRGPPPVVVGSCWSVAERRRRTAEIEGRQFCRCRTATRRALSRALLASIPLGEAEWTVDWRGR